MADTMTQKEMDAYYEDKGYYHKTDPRHPMNKELTGPSVTIAVGVPLPKKKPAEPKNKRIEPKNKRKDEKTKMAYGGMASGKKHMYVAGGSVMENPGLKALKKASPEAYKKIIGK